MGPNLSEQMAYTKVPIRLPEISHRKGLMSRSPELGDGCFWRDSRYATQVSQRLGPETSTSRRREIFLADATNSMISRGFYQVVFPGAPNKT